MGNLSSILDHPPYFLVANSSAVCFSGREANRNLFPLFPLATVRKGKFWVVDEDTGAPNVDTVDRICKSSLSFAVCAVDLDGTGNG